MASLFPKAKLPKSQSKIQLLSISYKSILYDCSGYGNFSFGERSCHHMKMKVVFINFFFLGSRWLGGHLRKCHMGTQFSEKPWCKGKRVERKHHLWFLPWKLPLFLAMKPFFGFGISCISITCIVLCFLASNTWTNIGVSQYWPRP